MRCIDRVGDSLKLSDLGVKYSFKIMCTFFGHV